MKKDKFVKNTMEMTIGASILPVGMSAVSGAGMGALGTATNLTMQTGLLKKGGKKFGVF